MALCIESQTKLTSNFGLVDDQIWDDIDHKPLLGRFMSQIEVKSENRASHFIVWGSYRPQIPQSRVANVMSP